MSFSDNRNSLYVIDDQESGEGSYTGFVCEQTLLPNGQGCMKYFERDNIISFDGEWDQGIWHGYGSLQFQSGDCYVGDFRNGSRDGDGTHIWRDGSQYEGHFKNDARTGKGRFAWPDGNYYKGDFISGKREGLGYYKDVKTGDMYSGHWKDGHYNGFGLFTWSDGRTYQGNWNMSRRHGEGIETGSNGKVVYNGMWHNHQPVDKKDKKEQGEGPDQDFFLELCERKEESDAKASSSRVGNGSIMLSSQQSRRTDH